MADIHVIKLTEKEAILKIYSTIATGATENITLASLTRSTEVIDPGVSSVNIKAMYWGIKQNKQLDVGHLVSGVLEGHYYLSNTGFYDFAGFVDNAYATSDLRVVSDGPFHLILHLTKHGWKSKVEPEFFGSYDNPNIVGG